MAAKKTKSDSFGPAMYILGAAAAVLLSWYAYQVFIHFTGDDEKKAAAAKETISAADLELLKLAEERAFKAEKVTGCEAVSSEYSTPDGEPLKGADVRRLLNLPEKAPTKAVRARCIEFAEAVAKMEGLSRHSLHVMVCGNSYYQVGGDSRYTIRPEPQGRGVIQTVTPALPKNLDIAKGRSEIIDNWQVYNMGRGCVIIGDSLVFEAKGATRRRGGFYSDDALKGFSFPK